jgi:hypothetical protein
MMNQILLNSTKFKLKQNAPVIEMSQKKKTDLTDLKIILENFKGRIIGKSLI